MPSQEYLDCEIRLTGYDQAELSVAGRDYAGRPALDEALQRRLLQADLDPKQYGTLLFESLLAGEGDDLLAGYREGLAIARHQEKRLRIRLHIATTAPVELQDFYWEYLYDPKTDQALGRSQETAFSRYLSVASQPGRTVGGRPALLVVVSAPTNLGEYGLPEIDRDQVRQSLEATFRPLQGAVACEFLDERATLGRIHEKLVESRFEALHLHAHGLRRTEDAPASLVLERDDGRAEFVDEALFAETCKGDTSLRLVTLIACHSGAKSKTDPFSGFGPSLVRHRIPVVIAMRRAISVDAAAVFTDHFYKNLARSGRVDQACNEARQQMYLASPQGVEWGTPALYMRLEEGRLWAASAQTARAGIAIARSTGEGVVWESLLERIDSGNLIPILGPGIYRGLLPSNEEIATHWAEKYEYPLNGIRSNNLPSVAHYLEVKMGIGFPHDTLPKILVQELLERQEVKERETLRRLRLGEVISRIAQRHFDGDPDEPHRILAELPISTYVTTNHDSFMAAALEWAGKTPRRQNCLWRGDVLEERDASRWAPEDPLVFHLYGHAGEPTSQVLTEDDYLDFLKAIALDFDACAPIGLKAKLTKSMLLFLGYNVQNLDCRVLFRGLVMQLKNIRRGRIALLQLDPEECSHDKAAEVKNFMEKCCEDLHISVYWGSERNFLIRLRDHWRSEHG